jgi:hypothetical protein
LEGDRVEGRWHRQCKNDKIKERKKGKEQKKQVHKTEKQKTALEHHITFAEVLYDKEDHMRSLISHLADMREWTTVLGEELTVDIDLK